MHIAEPATTVCVESAKEDSESFLVELPVSQRIAEVEYAFDVSTVIHQNPFLLLLLTNESCFSLLLWLRNESCSSLFLWPTNESYSSLLLWLLWLFKLLHWHLRSLLHLLWLLLRSSDSLLTDILRFVNLNSVWVLPAGGHVSISTLFPAVRAQVDPFIVHDPDQLEFLGYKIVYKVSFLSRMLVFLSRMLVFLSRKLGEQFTFQTSCAVFAETWFPIASTLNQVMMIPEALQG